MGVDQMNVADGLQPANPELLLQLIESTNDALWMFTPDWEELVFVNSAYADIFGQAVSTLQENPTAFLEAVHPDYHERVMDGMEQLAAGNPIELEFRVNPAQDYETWVWVQGEPIYDDSEEIEYIAGYTRDVTTRKEYQQQLEQHRQDLERSNESLREFAYIASHDLQEPLRMVSSYVDLLDQEYGAELDDDATEYMEYAVNGAQRMKRMINSLLEYSRVHTDASEFQTIDVNDVVDATLQDLELLIEDQDAEISVDEFPRLEADPDQIGQVFQNLIKNAIGHVSDGNAPKIDVTVANNNDVYQFAVSDNGPGIPQDQQEEIFKIFEKGPAASSTKNTGIGLAITQRIVQRHSGEIWVDSDPDEGATFKFTIPKATDHTAQESQL